MPSRSETKANPATFLGCERKQVQRMLALEISLNGKKAILAGFEDWDMLHAEVRALRARDQDAADELEMAVGGLAQQKIKGQHEFVRWARLGLSLGDELTIRLVEVSRADAPKKRYRSDQDVQEQPLTEEEILDMERETYLRLKKKFEGQSGK